MTTLMIETLVVLTPQPGEGLSKASPSDSDCHQKPLSVPLQVLASIFDQGWGSGGLLGKRGAAFETIDEIPDWTPLPSSPFEAKCLCEGVNRTVGTNGEADCADSVTYSRYQGLLWGNLSIIAFSVPTR